MNTEQSLSATDAALRQLWDRLLDTLLLYMQNTPPEQRRASMLDVARKFIRDSGLTIETGSAAEVKQSLQQLRDMTLPFKH